MKPDQYRRCSTCTGQGIDGTGCLGGLVCTGCDRVLCDGHPDDCPLRHRADIERAVRESSPDVANVRFAPNGDGAACEVTYAKRRQSTDFPTYWSVTMIVPAGVRGDREVRRRLRMALEAVT